MSYETGEFDTPVDIGNGNYLYENSIFHFEKAFGIHDTNNDGKKDTVFTRYVNDKSHYILKKEVANNENEGAVWEWSIIKNMDDHNDVVNINYTDLDGDGNFDVLSQLKENHPLATYRIDLTN